MREIFKQIEGYENYQVSNLGRVKRLGNNFKTKEKILKGGVSSNGYLSVNLVEGGKQKTYNIHQLVAMAFLNHVPCGYKKVVDHINNIKTDNRLINLQLITNRENSSKDKKNKTSKFVGVSWHKPLNKWVARIRIKEKRKHLGYFEKEIDAHNAYQNKLKKIN